MGRWLNSDAARELVGRGALVVDVRSPGELAYGRIPGSLNLPMHLLPQAAAQQLPSDRPLLVCCESGARSAMAVRYLHQLGFDAHDLGPWSLHSDLH